MKIANLFEDTDILQQAQNAAADIADKGLEEYPALKKRCDKLLIDEVVMN